MEIQDLIKDYFDFIYQLEQRMQSCANLDKYQGLAEESARLRRKLRRIRTKTIKTECVCPPHWTAIDDDTYSGPGSAIGTGTTEKDAIDDLLEKLDEEN